MVGEIARLRRSFEFKSTEMFTTIRGLKQTGTEVLGAISRPGQSQQQDIMSVLEAMGSLIGKLERLAPSAVGEVL